MKRRGRTLAVALAFASELAGCGGSTTNGTGGTGHCTAGACGGLGSGGVGGAAHSGGTGTGGRAAGGVPPATGGDSTGTGGSPVPGCTPSNGGIEICDSVDNDCDGNVDEAKTATHATGVDFADVHTCGNCATNCLDLPFVATLQCYPPNPVDGTTPGTCNYFGCESGHYDIDGSQDNGCEYTCPWNPDRSVPRDRGGPDGCGVDDDCNGKIDDGLEFCDDVDNCGACGVSCVLPHAITTKCVTQAASRDACDTTNTRCEVATCTPGWSDTNGLGEDGCEQGPPAPQPGPEVCDGYDNDGDISIDESGTPPDGIDGTASPGDPSVHIGDACGSAVGACKPGKWACVTGEFTCVGWVTPTRESCDGLDDDCNGTVDDDPVNGALCVTGSECVKTSTGVFECAARCSSSGFPCPAGLQCALVESSTHPGQTDKRCIRPE